MVRPFYFSFLLPSKSNKNKDPILYTKFNPFKPSIKRFVRGSVLCCDSTSNSDVMLGNRRFWIKRDKYVAIRVWKKVLDLGIRCEEEDSLYVDGIRGMENLDLEGHIFKEANSKGVQ